MRWNPSKRRKWHVWFAFFPTRVEDMWVWLEPYIYREHRSGSGMTRFYERKTWEGCAARVGYPCDCFRHDYF